jgi:nitrogen fixation protein NifU and related proteins
MTYDLRELYQEVILDHNKRPRNKGRLDDPTNEAEGYNPLCGDQVHVTIHSENGLISEIAFEGQGCAISTASASLMTEAVKGKTWAEAEAIFREFQTMVTSPDSTEDHEDLGSLVALAGVKDYPVRIKCATLPWHTLHAALTGAQKVSTE